MTDDLSKAPGSPSSTERDAQKRRIRALREEIGVLQDSRRPGWGAFDEGHDPDLDENGTRHVCGKYEPE